MGKSHAYYMSGAQFSTQRFIDGQLEGLQQYWYEDGHLKTELHYHKGLLQGETTLYSHSGHPSRQMHFAEGKRKGIERHWNEQGQLIVEAEYDGDILVGRSKRWHANGQLAEEVLYHGPVSKHDIRQWNVDGVLLREGRYSAAGGYQMSVWNAEGRLMMEQEGRWTEEGLVLAAPQMHESPAPEAL
jgi:antitoxin component YwqK of YwqJK toxin-antitoxin module